MNASKKKIILISVIGIVVVAAIVVGIALSVNKTPANEQVKDETELEAETEAETETDVKTETEAETDVKTETEAETDVETGVESETDVKTEAEPEIVITETANTMEFIDDDKPFYGIWIGTSGMYQGAEEIVLSDTHQYPLYIILTSDWSNLNPEPYYAVSIFKYETKEEAEDYLKYVKEDYPDAYVKYTGEKVGGDIRESYYMTVYNPGDIVMTAGKATIYANDEETGEIVGYVVDKDTVFASDAEMEFFEGYSEGDSALDWYKKMSVITDDTYSLALSGVFEVGLTENHIDVIYGTYWWD